jgi:hypothetical protein
MTNGKATTHDLSTTTNLQSNPFNAKAKFHAAVHVRHLIPLHLSRPLLISSFYFTGSCLRLPLAPKNREEREETDNQAVNASNRIQRLARSRSGSLDTLTSSIMSTSSPSNASPEKIGQGSRKSSLNAFTTTAGGDRESDDSGYVTAEDEDDSGQGSTAAERETAPPASRGIEDPTTRTTPLEAPPMEPSGSGVRGLMGRMRL